MDIIKKIKLFISLICILFTVGVANKCYATESLFDNLSKVIKESSKNITTILINTNLKENNSKFVFESETFNPVLLRINIVSDKEPSIDLSTYSDLRFINSYPESKISFINGKKMYDMTYMLEIFSKTIGEKTYVLKNNFLDENIILQFNFSKDKWTIETAEEKIGFKKQITIGMSAEKMFEIFPNPLHSSQLFNNNSRVIAYYFSEFRIGYQVLVINDIIVDVVAY